MKFEEFKQELCASYAKYFDGSRCIVEYSYCLGRSIGIQCYLSANDTETAHNIRANDMMNVCFIIHLPDNHHVTDELPEQMTLKPLTKCYALKPAPGTYYYCDMRTMKYRQTRGNAEKLIAQLDKCFLALYNSITDDLHADLIHQNYKNLVLTRLVRHVG